MAQVIDVMTFNGENAMLKLHLSILNNYVDKFVIVEANKTFSGQTKPLYFFRDERFFKPWHKKIEYYPMTEWDDPEIWEMAIHSPNTEGASHWKREFYIKESIHKALDLIKPQDDDLLFIGDVDEIIDPSVEFTSDKPVKAKLRVYSYYLNNRSNEEFYGTLIAQYKDIKGQCLNHMRSDPSLYAKEKYLGWHFTSMGGEDEIRRKLNDSYTTESYNTYDVQEKLKDRIRNREDYLGRDFTFTIDESDWPHYLTNNRKQYERLCLSHTPQT